MISLIRSMNKVKFKKMLVKMLVRILVSLAQIVLAAFFWGCVTQPARQFTDDDVILIQSKAQIKNDGETNTVKIEIALLPKKAIRLEITASLGVSVASVLLLPNSVTYALHTTKQYAIGPMHEKSLYPLFKKNIDPRILWRIINNQAMGNLNLECTVNSKQWPEKCVTTDGTLIKWTYDEYPRKRIDIISNRFEMSWLFRDQKLSKEPQSKTFVLKMPEGYKEIIIK